MGYFPWIGVHPFHNCNYNKWDISHEQLCIFSIHVYYNKWDISSKQVCIFSILVIIINGIFPWTGVYLYHTCNNNRCDISPEQVCIFSILVYYNKWDNFPGQVYTLSILVYYIKWDIIINGIFPWTGVCIIKSNLKNITLCFL